MRLQALSKQVTGYDTRILTDFYEPIFQSGVISDFLFLPSWQSSKGAKWEHDKAREYGIRVHYW